MTDDPDPSLDATLVAGDAAALHARLIEAEEALMEGHEARAALIVRDCIEDAGDLTEDIENL